MSASTYDISLDRNVNFSVSLALKDSSGAAINVTNHTVVAEIRQDYYFPVLQSFTVTKTNAAAGVVALSLTAAQTLNLYPGILKYEVIVNFSNGTSQKVLKGDLYVDTLADACNTEVSTTGVTGVIDVVETDFNLHNSSIDLQGGASGEYYHLTSGQYSNISGLIENNFDPSNDVYFEKNVHVSGTVLQGTGYNNYLTGLRVISDGNFSTNGDAQFSEYILKRETTDASTYELQFTNTSKKLSLPDNTSWYFKLRVVAKDTSNNTAIFNIDGAIKKGASAGFTQIVGKCTVLNIVDEIGAGGVSVSANTSYGYLQVDVVGKAATTIRWVGYLNLVEVK